MCFIRLNIIYLPLAKTPLSRKELYGLFFLTGARDFGHHIPHLLHVFWQYLTARSRFAQMTTSTPGAEQNAG